MNEKNNVNLLKSFLVFIFLNPQLEIITTLVLHKSKIYTLLNDRFKNKPSSPFTLFCHKSRILLCNVDETKRGDISKRTRDKLIDLKSTV
jgi:hypothetical protein